VTTLHAGPVSLHYANGDLRDVRLGTVEVVRRVYMVFQDRNWTARPWTILREEIQDSGDHFLVELTARGTFDAEDFTWTGRITGQADGTIAMRVEGSTSAPFIRNRLGLCILQPILETAGRPAILERVDGSLVQTAFPERIDPDQPFLDMRALTFEVADGLRATLRMEGETFESEDHRNWSDASFKHYCTPISLPFPVTVQPGEVVDQSVTLAWEGTFPPLTTEPSEVRIEVTDEVIPLPSIGIQLDQDGHRLTAAEVDALRALRLHHVRIDLGPADSADRLQGALADASAIGAQLVPALIGADPAQFSAHAADPRIDHWLVFEADAKVTRPSHAAAAAAVLGPRVTGGTNLYFTELNRARPAGPDSLAFSVNPQVHAWDDQTVMQNAMTQGVIARNARALYPRAHLEISPITLRPRFNPNATEPARDHSNTALPSRVDARQCQPFAAAWTVLSLKAIAESGCIDAVTYYQATGWEGLMERAEGSPQPEDFPSRPGEAFPVYAVLRALAGRANARRCVSSDPSVVDALALEDGSLLIANATGQVQTVGVGNALILVDAHAVTITQWKGLHEH
jgi:hypothetical protein